MCHKKNINLTHDASWEIILNKKSTVRNFYEKWKERDNQYEKLNKMLINKLKIYE